ncbi:MAG: dihydrolipoyl dehydrogenase [Nevskiaceae bacterium]|nr:MAG: dihydrolipoyl dehydrogenase [Nevskiaceae bacterium]TBR72689.1 MAG: dihydrolipoyl dehydrogenase [Nevskiaceae bacterium]
MSDFDIVVIGGGPGGYGAALYAASAGLKVALVSDNDLGGTCLNRGCIPAKSLLQTAEVLRNAQHAGDFGIVPNADPKGFKADWKQVSRRTTGVVDKLVGGLGGLLKQRKVEVINGHGQLDANGQVKVGKRSLSSRAVIIATGSQPKSIPGFAVDGKTIVTSDHTSRGDTLPKRIAIIGGGVIGVEFASVYADVGVETTLLEALPTAVLPVGPDEEIAKVLAKALAKRGVKVLGGARVSAPKKTAKGLQLDYETAAGKGSVEVDQVLVAIGRAPVTEGLGLQAAGVQVDERGFIKVDATTLATTCKGVYAIGDVIKTPGLAHVAYAEAVAAVQSILGERPTAVDYGRVPFVVYTHPEVAWVGMSEAEAKAAKLDFEVRKFRFAGNGRAMILGETDGMVKVIAAKNGPLLGVHMVGPWVSELLAENYLAVNWQALPGEVGAFIHPHPSLSEAVGEVMLSFTGRSLHYHG